MAGLSNGVKKNKERELKVSQKVPLVLVSSFRQKPESSVFNWLRILWTPVFTGVTTFYEFIKIESI
jgi:hypothetical protein